MQVDLNPKLQDMDSIPSENNSVSKGLLKTIKAKEKATKVGVWSNSQINDRIQQLTKELKSTENISISRKKRIKERLITLKKGLSGKVIIGGQLEKKKIKFNRKASSTPRINRNYPEADSNFVKKPHKSIKCLQCRRWGHLLKDCPLNRTNSKLQNGSDINSPSTHGFCFNCGKIDHILKNCKKPRPKDGSLAFAVCFLCNQKGHLAVQCSLNSKGMFPNGGGCRICGSVYHKQADCSEKLKKNKTKKLTSSEEVSNTKIDTDPDEYWLNKINN